MCGDSGHSGIIGLYADGDGDFHPKFEFDTPFEYNYDKSTCFRTREQLIEANKGSYEKVETSPYLVPEVMFG